MCATNQTILTDTGAPSFITGSNRVFDACTDLIGRGAGQRWLAYGDAIYRVTDQGPGICPEEQAKLFKVGSVLSTRPTGGEPQTGIGLDPTGSAGQHRRRTCPDFHRLAHHASAGACSAHATPNSLAL